MIWLSGRRSVCYLARMDTTHHTPQAHHAYWTAPQAGLLPAEALVFTDAEMAAAGAPRDIMAEYLGADRRRQARKVADANLYPGS